MSKTFNDIEDTGLRISNRVKVMANIFEDNYEEGKGVSSTGGVELIKYFKEVPEKERGITLEAYKNEMIRRGYIEHV